MYTAAAATAAAAAAAADRRRTPAVIVEHQAVRGKPRNDLRSSPTSRKGSGFTPGLRMTAQMTGYGRPRGRCP